jgi:hypothetical protein
MASWEVTYDMAMRKLFAVQKMKYPCPEFTKDTEWYSKKTWTSKQQNKYCNWLRQLIKKRHRLSVHRTNTEVGMFNLQYGWRVNDTKAKE